MEKSIGHSDSNRIRVSTAIARSAQNAHTITHSDQATHLFTDLYVLVLYTVLITLPSIAQSLTSNGYILNGVNYGLISYSAFMIIAIFNFLHTVHVYNMYFI